MRFVHQHADHISSADGREFVAQVYAAEHRDRTWTAWCVFFPVKGDDFAAGDRETEQSSFESVRYWASGLTHRYFEGALDRALSLANDAVLARHEGDEEERLEQRAREAAAYAAAAAAAHDRAHEIQVMKRAMRRGIRFG